MEYQKLGQTDLNISRVGFGCYPMGGWDWGKVSDRNSVFAVKRALELGINFFDTADIYGLGHSERILSKALGEYRKKVVIATKVGLKWDDNKRSSFCDLSQKHIIKAVENSLFRLKIDCIPLYQIHYPDYEVPIFETINTLKKIQKDGKIRYIGVCNFPLKLIDKFQKYGRIESLQISYNILNREVEKTILLIRKRWEMSVLSYRSLVQGFLSGKYNKNTKFSEDDHRSKDENFKGKKLIANLVIVDKIKKLAVQYNKTCAQIAINWVLNNPYITSAIVGIKTPEQIEQNAKAVNWRISAEDYKIITEAAIEAHKNYNL